MSDIHWTAILTHPLPRAPDDRCIVRLNNLLNTTTAVSLKETECQFIMDYLVLGSNGFAQMGDSAFYKKLKIEMRVLLDYFYYSFPIPQKFKSLAYYSVKTFHHDFGDYQEIVLWYDRTYLESLEESGIESETQIIEVFRTWFHVIDSAYLESEEITDQIREGYFKSVDVSKGEHLSVSIAS